MADAELFGRYRDSLSTNAALVQAEIRDLLAATAGMSDEQAYQFVLENYPKLVKVYGRIAAEVARQYYQDQRDEEDLEQEYTATSAGGGDDSWYQGDVNQAYGKIRPDQDHLLNDPNALIGRSVQRVMERADFTIGLNARRDPAHPKWAVVAHPGACGWCVMVSSNGWSYSKAGANAQRHANCKCSIAVSFDDDPSLDGYDPEAMRESYAIAEETVHDDIERQWSSMSDEERAKYRRKGRSAKDVFKTKQVTAEMNRRDRAWLQDPSKPSPRTFATKQLEKETREKRPWEISTTDVLTANGFRCDHVVDRRFKSHSENGDIFIGLPDLSDGTELKALINGKSAKSSVNRAMRDAGCKDGIKVCCIDNQCGLFDDSECINEIIRHQHGRHVDDVLFIDSGKHVQRIRWHPKNK